MNRKTELRNAFVAARKRLAGPVDIAWIDATLKQLGCLIDER
ncbi:MAG: hypothetical protein NTW53_16200 [Burkholderiales bacterium]|nr:hypothetical protein [Burkholderiales bacterium]